MAHESLHIFHSNAIDSATLAGGSWLAALPLANLREQRPTLKARSTDAQLTSTQLTAALAEVLVSHGIQIISTNLSSAAQYRITWYTDNTFTTAVDTTGWIAVGSSIDWTNTAEWLAWEDNDFWLGAESFVDPDNQGRDVRHQFDPAVSVQYLKIEFDDTTNVDGFVQAGYLFVGEAFVPSMNISYEPTFARIALTSMQEAVGGSQYFNRRGSRKTLSVAWSQLPRDEVFGEIDQIVQIHDLDRPVYIDLDPGHAISGSISTAFLARIARLPEYRLINVFFENGDIGASVGFEFTQVL